MLDPMSWTIEQVLALATDASSAKSGKDLSAPGKWLTLGANDACVWATIQGSGPSKAGYRTLAGRAGDYRHPGAWLLGACPNEKLLSVGRDDFLHGTSG